MAEPVGKDVKLQVGSVDLGMEPAKAGAVAGERKAVTSVRPRSGENQAAACLEALIRELGKTAFGEQTGEASGAPECAAQYRCMPVVSEAVNQVTWNLFLFGAAFWAAAPCPS